MARMNVLDQLKAQYGEYFLNFIDSRTLQLKVKQLFRQISRSQVDLAAYSDALLDDRLIDACILAAKQKFEYHDISANCIRTVQSQLVASGQLVDITMDSVLNSHQMSANAYNIILNAFNMVKIYKDINQLYSLPSALSQYRDYI